MILGKPNYPLYSAELRLGEQVLNEVEVVKVLGILLQANLKWNEQVNAMISKGNKRIFMLRTLKQFNLPRRDLMLVYTGYIRPVVEYGVPVWHPGLSPAPPPPLRGRRDRMRVPKISSKGVLFVRKSPAREL